MYRIVVIAILVLLTAPGAAQTRKQPTVEQQQGVKTSPPDTDIKAGLDGIIRELTEHVKKTDTLLQDLRAVGAQGPEDTRQKVQLAEQTLSTLADRLAPNGPVSQQLLAFRNSAAVHRSRVLSLPKDSIEEGDRSQVLAAWDQVIADADAAQITLNNMRAELLGALERLRKRSVAIGELLLAGRFAAAIASFNNWIGELQTTVDKLRKNIAEVTSAPGS